MKNVMKHTMQIVLGLAMASLLFCSCEKRKENNYAYLAVQTDKDEGWSIIDKNGKTVVEDEYDKSSHISAVYDGVFWVYSGDKYQLFSVKNPKKPVVDEEFTHATEFHAGRSAVSAPNQKIRIINTSGKTVATLDKDIKRCYEFSEYGYAVVMNTDDKFGVIDKNGKEVIKPVYEDMNYEINGGIILATKRKDDKKILILDTKGNSLGNIDIDKYDVNALYSEGKIVVNSQDSDDRRQEVLDKEGNKLFTIKKSDGYNYDKYKDGYLTFGNADYKYGIVDAKGNEVIRAKYDAIINLGNGEFAVAKDDKWGIVNAKDEENLDFDYSSAMSFKVGGNYVMADGEEFLLIKKGSNNETLTSFYDYSLGASKYAVYISVDNIVKKIMQTIEEYEHPKTADDMANDLALNANDYKRKTSISNNISIEDGVLLNINISFPQMTKEKTHSELVSSYYGYYVYERSVSDGWYWTKDLPNKITGSLSIVTDGIDTKTIKKELEERIAQGREKENDNTYRKTVNNNGKDMKVYVSIPDNDDSVSFTITYNNNKKTTKKSKKNTDPDFEYVDYFDDAAVKAELGW